MTDFSLQMINPTGRVVTVPFHMKKQLLAQGFKIIVNPKQEWYPQYDAKNSGYWKDQNVTENIPVENLLEVDQI